MLVWKNSDQKKKEKIDAFVKWRDPWIRGHLLLHFKNISFFPVNGTKVFQIVDTGSMMCVFVCVCVCVCVPVCVYEIPFKNVFSFSSPGSLFCP